MNGARHFHAIHGFPGCMPEGNEPYRTKKQARQGMKENVNIFRQPGERWRGNKKHDYFERTDGGYYAEVNECYESECLKEIEE
jgi:hypothetical protein